MAVDMWCSIRFKFLMGKTMAFPDLNINTGNWLFWSLLMSCTCGRTPGFMDSLANRDMGLPAFNFTYTSHIRVQFHTLATTLANKLNFCTTHLLAHFLPHCLQGSVGFQLICSLCKGNICTKTASLLLLQVLKKS